jgi:hypothetical protein
MHTLARRACDWRCFGLIGLALAAQLALASAANDGCEKFAWSLARERAWFAVSGKISVAAESVMGGETALNEVPSKEGESRCSSQKVSLSAIS